jgi:hypothetical protein
MVNKVTLISNSREAPITSLVGCLSPFRQTSRLTVLKSVCIRRCSPIPPFGHPSSAKDATGARCGVVWRAKL